MQTYFQTLHTLLHLHQCRSSQESNSKCGHHSARCASGAASIRRSGRVAWCGPSAITSWRSDTRGRCGSGVSWVDGCHGDRIWGRGVAGVENRVARCCGHGIGWCDDDWDVDCGGDWCGDGGKRISGVGRSDGWVCSRSSGGGLLRCCHWADCRVQSLRAGDNILRRRACRAVENSGGA
jgi:hypothetical protein